MSQKEEGRPDLNRREKEALEMIIVCSNEMYKHGDVLKARLKSAHPRGYNWFRIALGLLNKVLDLIYATIPKRQLEHLYEMCKIGEVRLVTSASVITAPYIPIKARDVNVLCDAAVNNKCALCIQNGLEARSCELRKTLMTFCPPTDLPKYGDCPYQGVRWTTRNEPNIPDDSD